MELVEVLLRGPRGTDGLYRWTFPSGPAVLTADDVSSLAVRSVFELLAGVRDGARLPTSATPDEDGARVVLVMKHAQRWFCVRRDPATGRRVLQQQRGDSWETLEIADADFSSALSALAGVPSASVLRDLVFAPGDDRPTTDVGRAASSTPSGTAPPPQHGASALASASTASSRRDHSDSATRQREPGGEHRTPTDEEIAATEFELNGLHQDLFHVESTLKPLATRADQLERRRQQLANAGPLEVLGQDFLHQVANVRQAEGGLVRHLRQLDDDERNILDNARGLPAEAYARRRQAAAVVRSEPWVKTGLLVGTGAIILAAVGALFHEQWRYLALLDVPAFGLAMLGAWRVLTVLEDGAHVRARLDRVAAERTRERERVTGERAALDHRLIAAGFGRGTEGEVETALQSHLAEREELRLAAESLRAAEHNVGAAALREKRAALSARIGELEERLAAAATRSPSGAADFRASSLPQAAAPLDPVHTSRSARPTAIADETGPGPGDVARRIVRATAIALADDAGRVGTLLAARASRFLLPLLGHRFSEVRVGSHGDIEVVDVRSGSSVPLPHLAAQDRDLLLLTLRLTAHEAVADRNPLPLVLDRVVDQLPPECLPLVARALHHLGQSMQVICLTTRRELAEVGPLVTASVEA